MSQLFLPPSPNWYCSHACDVSSDGLVAFGTRNRLQVLDFKRNFEQISESNEAPETEIRGADIEKPRNVAIFEAHAERVTSVVFSKINTKRLATTGDDGVVRVWELGEHDKFENVLEHTGHGGDKVLCVEWSPLVDDLIFSGDESGSVIIWTYNNRTQPLKTLAPEKSSVTCLASSPHNERYLAIGYQSSLVLLMDLHRGGHILHKLRGHDDDIQSLAWSPFWDETYLRQASNGETPMTVVDDPEDYFSEPVKPETGLVLTSSRDRTIRLWSLTTGKQLQLLRLPTNTGYRKDNYVDNKNRVWITLHWLKDRPHQFLSSTHGGELLLWDLRRPSAPVGTNKQSAQKWQVVDQHSKIKSHHRIIFNMVACGKFVCSIGLDRKICIWDTEKLRCVETLHTCGGFVYCIEGSQLMPGKLALGIGDQMIRLWNTCNPANEFDILNLWQGIKSKVTCLSWHPVKEGMLAYGTEDGRVGIYDTLNNKPPSISSTFHKRFVYVVRWGPPCDSDSDEFVLYSVGDGVILCHDRKHLDRDAVNVHDVIKRVNDLKHPKSRSGISWKPDFSAVAIGNDDGSVEIYSPRTMKLLATLAVNQKLVNVIAWHPQHTSNDVTKSQYENWLAIGSNNSDIHVCDVNDVLSDVSGDVAAKKITECTKTLSFHKGRVTALSWSPHQEGLLVSVSYDGVAQVWDVPRGKPMVNYLSHRARLLAVLWNPLDPDSVYTGGEDFSVHRWRISEQAQLDHPGPLPQHQNDRATNAAKAKNKKKRKARAGAISVVPVETDDKPPILVNDIQKLIDEKRAELSEEVDPTSSKLDAAAKPFVPQAKMATEPIDIPRDDVDPTKMAAEIQERQRGILENIGAKLHIQLEIPRNRNLDTIKSEPSRKRRPAALFPFSNSMECRNRSAQLDDCQALFNAFYGRDLASHQEKLCSDVNFVHLGVYAEMKAFQTMLRAEENYLLEHSRVEQYLQIQVFRGDLSKVLENAAQSGYLSDWLIAMASGSKQPSYLQACSALASQLEREEMFVKAATYHLACHQVHKAVDLLMNNNYFREAVTLARLRLFRKDPKLNAVYTAWAEHYIELGSLEHAAKCYLALHDPVGAAKLLGSRSDRASLRLACDMISKLEESGFGEDGLLKDYCARYIRQCQMECDWRSGMEFVMTQLDMKDVELELSVHQTLLESLQQVNVLQKSTTWQPWVPGSDVVPAQHVPAFFLAAAPEILMLPWKPYSTGNQSYLHSVLRRWLKFHQLDLSESEYLYQRMSDERARVKDTGLWKQALIAVSRDLTLALLAYLDDHSCLATRHLLDSMATCYHGEHLVLLKGLCRLFLPHGPGYLPQFVSQVQGLRLAMSENVQPTSTPEKISPSLLRSISTFYWYSIVHDLRCDLLLAADGKAGDPAVCSGDVLNGEEKKACGSSTSPPEQGDQTIDQLTVTESKRTLKDLEQFLTPDMVLSLVDEFQQLDLAKRFHYDRVVKLLDDRVRSLIISHKTSAVKQNDQLLQTGTTEESSVAGSSTQSGDGVSLIGKYITIDLTDPGTISQVRLNDKLLESPTVEITEQQVSFSKTTVDHAALLRTQVSVADQGDSDHEPDYVVMKRLPSQTEAPSRPEYAEVPGEWYGLRAVERYHAPCVTLAILSEEKQYYQALIQGLPDEIQSMPYPDVLNGAADLLSMFGLAKKKLKLKHDLQPAMESLQIWLQTIDTL